MLLFLLLVTAISTALAETTDPPCPFDFTEGCITIDSNVLFEFDFYEFDNKNTCEGEKLY